MGVFNKMLRLDRGADVKTKEAAIDPAEPFQETGDEEKTRREVEIEERRPSFESHHRCEDPKDEDRQSSSGHKKSVSFTHLDLRMYNVTIGDHPCCQNGCPLTLDWDYIEAGALPIDQYEAERSPRRSVNELRKSSEERHQILSEDGHSDVEIKRVQRKLHRIRSCSAKLCHKTNDSFFQKNVEKPSS